MSIAYEKSVSGTKMLDGRRRPWVIPGKPGWFKVISRDGRKRYEIPVIDGAPRCPCIAGTGDNGRFKPRACWHAKLVYERITRQPELVGGVA